MSDAALKITSSHLQRAAFVYIRHYSESRIIPSACFWFAKSPGKLVVRGPHELGIIQRTCEMPRCARLVGSASIGRQRLRYSPGLPA
jgi:hypothetical protein